MEDEEVEDFTDAELFDTSDITFDFQRTKGNTKIYLIMKSESPINIMRFYLAIKAYLFQMEAELGIMEEPPEVM